MESQHRLEVEKLDAQDEKEMRLRMNRAIYSRGQRLPYQQTQQTAELYWANKITPTSLILDEVADEIASNPTLSADELKRLGMTR
jgi:hypothetical protein